MECQAGFSGAANARYHRQFVAGNGNVNVLEVVLAGASNFDVKGRAVNSRLLGGCVIDGAVFGNGSHLADRNVLAVFFCQYRSQVAACF